MIHNYKTGVRVAAHGPLLSVLDRLEGWTTAGALADAGKLEARMVAPLLEWLHDQSLVDASPGRVPAGTQPDAWSIWGPSAAFFHFGTRDVRFVSSSLGTTDEAEYRRSWRVNRTINRSPKVLEAVPTVPSCDFTQVLLGRRTWRRFGRAAAPLEALTAVLALTFGVQRWMDLGHSIAALRTSPSAGARQPIEAYVLARNIRGLRRGIYHFQPASGALVRLRSPRRMDVAIRTYLPGQPWYAGASCVVLMTAALRRTASKYDSPHAYRTLLLEAGHFCQTFCLVATALHLAPFCTAALADSVIEHDLGVDPSVEPVIYAAGFGTRPVGRTEGRTPRGEREPLEIAAECHGE